MSHRLIYRITRVIRLVGYEQFQQKNTINTSNLRDSIAESNLLYYQSIVTLLGKNWKETKTKQAFIISDSFMHTNTMRTVQKHG